MKKNTKKLAESAVLLALGTVLSLFTFAGPWALGGGITVCSMLPLVLLCRRWGPRWGAVCSLCYGLIQLAQGISNVQYANSLLMAAGIVLLDYVLAFGAMGFCTVFDGRLGRRGAEIAAGVALGFALRFVCHFLSGLWIWEVLFPNELGWAPALWSLAYNASYIVPEAIITALAAYLVDRSIGRFFAKTA